MGTRSDEAAENTQSWADISKVESFKLRKMNKQMCRPVSVPLLRADTVHGFTSFISLILGLSSYSKYFPVIKRCTLSASPSETGSLIIFFTLWWSTSVREIKRFLAANLDQRLLFFNCLVHYVNFTGQQRLRIRNDFQFLAESVFEFKGCLLCEGIRIQSVYTEFGGTTRADKPALSRRWSAILCTLAICLERWCNWRVEVIFGDNVLRNHVAATKYCRIFN